MDSKGSPSIQEIFDTVRIDDWEIEEYDGGEDDTYLEDDYSDLPLSGESLRFKPNPSGEGWIAPFCKKFDPCIKKETEYYIEDWSVKSRCTADLQFELDLEIGHFEKSDQKTSASVAGKIMKGKFTGMETSSLEYETQEVWLESDVLTVTCDCEDDD